MRTQCNVQYSNDWHITGFWAFSTATVSQQCQVNLLFVFHKRWNNQPRTVRMEINTWIIDYDIYLKNLILYRNLHTAVTI